MHVSSLWEGKFCATKVFDAENISLYEISSAFQNSLVMKDVKVSNFCPSIVASLILEISRAGVES
jgi:hypothetical protein